MSWYHWLRKVWQRDEGGTEPLGPVQATGERTEDHPSIPPVTLAAGPFELRVGVVSDIGTVREHNEDNYFVSGRNGLGTTGLGERASRSVDPDQEGPPGLFIVADGMGGQNAGEKASEMAVTIVPTVLRRRLNPDDDERSVKRALRESVAEANQEILAQSHLIPEFANMGTTIVLGLFRGGRAYITGIGDSRAYRLRDGRLERLTEDHSLADALEKAGTIRPEEVENHKFRNVLYLYLGSKDAREGPEEIRALDLRRGDQFLLTTDGLTTVVRDDVIAEVLRSTPDPQRAARALVNRALENRSRDNVTCLVIHVL